MDIRNESGTKILKKKVVKTQFSVTQNGLNK